MLDIIWTLLIIYLLFLSTYFLFKLKFKTLNIFKMIKSINKNTLDIFYILIATKVGVGSIIGTTIAIYVGGSGTILWIWIFAFITIPLIYVESILGNKYKEKLNDSYVGGPNFYIKKGLNNKILSNIYLVVLVISYSFFFLMIQTNTINVLFTTKLFFNKYLIFIIITIILILIIISSPKEILKYINKVVPFMCLFLIIICLYVVIININNIPKIFNEIITNAFNIKSISLSFIPILLSIKRSIFQNELLIGTTSISSSIKNENIYRIASTSVIANLFITYIICTLIAFLIILFKLENNFYVTDYIDLITNVFVYHYNNIGIIILTILMSLFAFTTIVSGFYFGLTNLMYLTKKRIVILFFRISVLLFTLSGIVLDSSIIWYLIDIMMFILIVINTYSITKLRSKIW